jgi:hypothetical protein
VASHFRLNAAALVEHPVKLPVSLFAGKKSEIILFSEAFEHREKWLHQFDDSLRGPLQLNWMPAAAWIRILRQ